MTEFKIGEIVALKSGGPAMTVTSITKGKHQCTWFDGKKVYAHSFPVGALELSRSKNDDVTAERARQVAAARRRLAAFQAKGQSDK